MAQVVEVEVLHASALHVRPVELAFESKPQTVLPVDVHSGPPHRDALVGAPRSGCHGRRARALTVSEQLLTMPREFTAATAT